MNGFPNPPLPPQASICVAALHHCHHQPPAIRTMGLCVCSRQARIYTPSGVLARNRLASRPIFETTLVDALLATVHLLLAQRARGAYHARLQSFQCRRVRFVLLSGVQPQGPAEGCCAPLPQGQEVLRCSGGGDGAARPHLRYLQLRAGQCEACRHGRCSTCSNCGTCSGCGSGQHRRCSTKQEAAHRHRNVQLWASTAAATPPSANE